LSLKEAATVSGMSVGAVDTNDLILALSRDVRPVTPLGQPGPRMVAWAAVAAAYLSAVTLVVSPRNDLDLRLRDPQFLIEQVAALVTALTAAFAAFATIVPGQPRRVVWLPALSACTWLAIVAAGAARDAQLVQAGTPLIRADWGCVWTILVGAAVPATIMGRMLRQGAPFTPHLTAALGGLAAAGIGNSGICLFHAHTSNVTVLVWHGGTVLMLALLTGIAGTQILPWPPRLRSGAPILRARIGR
jgi:hypothetical protein